MGWKEADPAEFFRKRPAKHDSAKYEARTPLSAVVDRPIRLTRAPQGTANWKQGLLLVVDVETGDILATVPPAELRDPKTKWPLRADC